MRFRQFGYAFVTATLLAVPACSGPNNAVDETRPDAAANDRANRVTNGTDNPEGAQAGATRDREATGTTGTLGRAGDRIADATSDATVTMKIQAKYASDEVVKSRDIDVDTTNGVVTIKGQVDSRRERDAAEQIARSTEGVKRVVNELTVRTPSR
jgi:osmotically-inducible protein OsmY